MDTVWAVYETPRGYTRCTFRKFEIVKRDIRLCIYPKDIQRVLSKSYRQSCRVHMQIKTRLNKTPGQYVTVKEFCEHTGLDYEEVLRCIGGK